MPRFAPYGYSRGILNIPITLPGTSAVTALNALALAFQFEIEKVKAVVTTVGAGAGATRVLNVRKGSATGTVVATATLTLAGTTPVGTVIDLPVTTTGVTNVFGDADTLTVEFPAGGTAFSGGVVELVVLYRMLAQKRS